jgi:hypothetical protein
MEHSPETAMRGASSRHRSRWRAAGIFIVVVLALAGMGALLLGQRQDQARLIPPAPGAAPTQTAEPVPAQLVSMARSAPTEIRIARIGVKAKVVNVGLDANGAIEVPSLEHAELAGWYELGPSPGEIGNAIVVGHVDSYAIGPAVFFRLGALRSGDAIEIRRQDGTVAKFIVDRVGSYPKSSFPTDLVYGDSDKAGLRLITCGGPFDESARSYLNNVIVFATRSP